ncbi:DEAD/DEAH box helicase family protein [Streptomyces sp. NPDC058691]|uniref:DEAD/DEAH box helicase family protein n=1 Tax=Streptomyces sp. NPDC058691 TaxID=3346601 RepID=UPI00365B21F4
MSTAAPTPAVPDPASGRAVLRPDQQTGHGRAVRHLRRAGMRGLYVSACGTGKTLVGVRLAGTLGSRLTLVVVPTLDLIAQTALAWRKDGRAEAMVAVCSMDTRAHPGLAEANVGSTGDAAGLAAALSAVGTGVLPAVTVLCTYDSLDKIEAAQRTGRMVPPFDLAVMDEAHRIAAPLITRRTTHTGARARVRSKAVLITPTGTGTGRVATQAIASGSTRLRPLIAEAARQGLRLAFTVRMPKTGYLHPSGSRTDSPGIRRDVIQRTDHTEERSYGSASTGGFDAADFARRVDAVAGDVTAAVQQWLVETGRIQADAHITHLEIRTWRPR